MGPPPPFHHPATSSSLSSSSSSLPLLLLFIILPIASPSSMRTAADEAEQLANTVRTTRSARIPDALMNPVYRQHFRQRLRMLDTMRRKAAAAFQASSRALSPPPPPPPHVPFLPPAVPALHHHRNCFFSPINCHLPVMAARSPSNKRHISAEYQPLHLRARGSRQQRVWSMTRYNEDGEPKEDLLLTRRRK